MKCIEKFDLRCVHSMGMLLFGALFSSATPILGDSWSRTVLEQGSALIELDNGFPVLDTYGDVQPLLPENYQPSAVMTTAGLNVLRFTTEMSVPPYEVDSEGFPVLDDYFRFDYAELNDTTWTVGEPVTGWLTDIEDPAFASRIDDVLSVYYWKDSSVYIATQESPNPTLLTLPILAEKGTVAIDANGGVHVLSINAAYELWHRYYDGDRLAAVKLSDGPVCDVVAVAGEGDECHVAYTTFSEDLNLNEVLDDGEDLNGNSILDLVSHQVIYQSIAGNMPAVADVVVDEALSRVCHFDLLFSPEHGLRIGYAIR